MNPKVVTWQQFAADVALMSQEPSKQWVFRGGREGWELESTLERACHAWGIGLAKARRLEWKLVREFRRHPEARGLVIDRDDCLEWLALMQHNGAPTRLLDWTYSPFVAAYFAFEAVWLDPSQCRCAKIWALDVKWLRKNVHARLKPAERKLHRMKKHAGVFEKLYVKRHPPLLLVDTATPRSLNQNMSVQQGVFLCPGNVTRSWADNLRNLGPSTDNIVEFMICRSEMLQAFRTLKLMSVTARSLFPGLPGYAKSIGHRALELLGTSVPAP